MKRSLIIKMLIAMLTLMLFSCNGSPKNKKLNIIATTNVVYDLALQIGGENIDLEGLMGPGVDPHLYRASQGDIRRLSNADIIFFNGLKLEAKLAEVLEKMSETKTVVAITQSIPKSKLLTPLEFEGAYDPHVWFDVELWIMAVEVVGNTLMKADKENKNNYQKRMRNYISQLKALNKEIKTTVASIPVEKRYLITAHDAFNYYAQAYSIKVAGLQGISTESKAGIKDIQNIVELIIKNNIPTIFVESSVSAKTIQAVQASVKSKGRKVSIGEPLFSDALGERGTLNGTYVGMMKHNLNAIYNGLIKGDIKNEK